MDAHNLKKASIEANIEYRKQRIQHLEEELAKEKMYLTLEQKSLEEHHDWGLEF